ncbi:hypothetical protein U1Q18_002172, partial [Sarracenia purpurea var. burkii]
PNSKQPKPNPRNKPAPFGVKLKVNKPTSVGFESCDICSDQRSISKVTDPNLLTNQS